MTCVFVPLSWIHFLFLKPIIPPPKYWYLRRLQRPPNVSSLSPTRAGLRQMLIVTNYSSRFVCAPFPSAKVAAPNFTFLTLSMINRCSQVLSVGNQRPAARWVIVSGASGLLMNDCTDKVAVVAHKSRRGGGVTGKKRRSRVSLQRPPRRWAVTFIPSGTICFDEHWGFCSTEGLL